MPSQQKHKIHCAIPLHLLCVPLPLSCIHPSLYICIWGTVVGMSTSFFHKISLGFSQENKTKVQIKNKKKHSRNLFVLLFSKTHQKKNTNHPLFSHTSKTHINLNLKALVLKTSPNPKRRTFSRRQKSTDRSSKRRSSAEAWGPLCKCRPGPGIDEGRLEMCQLYPLVNEHSWLENQHFLIGDTSTQMVDFPLLC